MKLLSSLFLLLSLFAACTEQTSPPAHEFPSGKWIDLTHTFNEQTIYWPTASNFALDTVFEGMTEKGYYYSAYQFCSAEHGGTHLDAPVHFSAGKHTVDQVPIDQLIGPAIIIDVSEQALTDRDYLITIEDFRNWEAQYGPMPEEVIVLLRTGYDQFWGDPIRYMGTDEKGEQAVADLHFPGLDPDAASWLSENRDIKAIGLDTPSIDYGQSTLYESHQILFSNDIPAFENVANLQSLPPKGSHVVALPMKIGNGSGAPLRIVAFVPEGI